MNKSLFRIVFNARRGLRMAVAETAASQGKSVTGDCAPGVCRGPARTRTAWRLTAEASLVALSVLCVAPLNAQVIADRNAPGNQRTTILQTANGLAQINIQSPSAAGVSRNTYSQFDVQRNGVVLNNSRTNVGTQLGGYVQGNPWLAAGSARVILNEVHSSNASQLKGWVEVAGQRAEVIIANPAGIAVSGGGFLNASAVTLTTGTPVMHSGSLDSLQVRGGQVTVDGAGLDTGTADYTNILARGVQVNAGIWARDLKVVTGSNDISAARAATPGATLSGAAAGAPPAFALDVAALGGMYAGKIFLVGTEAGLGVRNAGVIGATAGDVVLSNEGWLTNSGTLQANGPLQASARAITNTAGATMQSAGTQLRATETLTNRGLIDAVNASGDAVTRITAATVNNLGTGAIFGDVVGIAASTLNNLAESANGSVSGATMGARRSLHIGVQTLNNSDMGLDSPARPSENISASPSVHIQSLGDLVVGGSLDADGHAMGRAIRINNSSAVMHAAGSITLNANALHNTDAHFAAATQTRTTVIQKTLGSAADGYYVNLTGQTVTGPVVTAALPGTVSAAKDLTIRANDIDNANSQLLAGATLDIPTAVSLRNAGVSGVQTTTMAGTAYTLQSDHHCQLLVFGSCVSWGPWYSTWQASAYSSSKDQTLTVGAGVAAGGVAASGQPGNSVPASSLYRIITKPNSSYVVETNPAFTHYRTWLGSDYMLRSVALDPTVTGQEAHYIAPQIKQKDGSYKEDPGGMSYGPFQLSSKTGGLEDFMNYLNGNKSEEAKSFLSELNQAGGLEGARDGKVAFMEKFMELTQKDPQFVEYQFESVNQGSNMKFLRKETRVAGLEFDGLPTESKEALFSSAVQHGGGGANKALDQALSRNLVNPAEDNFAIKQMQYNDAIKDSKDLITQEKALITQRESLIIQLDRLKDQKIKLLEGNQGASGEALKGVAQQIETLNQKIEVQSAKVQEQSAKVQANEAFIKNTQAVMKDAGFKANADPEQFIKDIYEWRIKHDPSEAKSRYIPERDMLLKQLKERLEQEKAAKP